ncbi:hypothetical protein [Klebsiella grimontii]|nr:hypothetical protein [Klebsiella grimontii]VUS40983.1 hypothetical protein SPARK1531C2_04913 [Klebsiella grimontii]
MPSKEMKRHVILYTIHIPERKLRPVKWLALISSLLFMSQLAIETVIMTE